MKPFGPLLASGRDSDIFDYGPGLVVRRSRGGASMVEEARTMEYLRRHGYPVPAIEEVSDDGSLLVLERIEGPTMVAAMSRRPWTIRRQGAVLAGLHQRLHEIPPPDFLPPAPIGRGDHFLHMDLHPLNVMLGRKGPVVIDWPRAARGDPASDVAVAWVLMASGEVPSGALTAAILGRARTQLVKSFLAPFDRSQVEAQLRVVVAWKTQDAHMTPSERQAMWRLVESVAIARSRPIRR